MATKKKKLFPFKGKESMKEEKAEKGKMPMMFKKGGAVKKGRKGC